MKSSALFLLFACAVIAAPRYPPTIHGAKVEVYKKASGTELKVWIFNPEGHVPDDARPAVVFFFGGGWKSGSPGQFEQQCRYLSNRGMVAVTAEYRIRNLHGTLATACVRKKTELTFTSIIVRKVSCEMRVAGWPLEAPR